MMTLKTEKIRKIFQKFRKYFSMTNWSVITSNLTRAVGMIVRYVTRPH